MVMSAKNYSEGEQGGSTVTEVRYRPADDGVLLEHARSTYD